MSGQRSGIIGKIVELEVSTGQDCIPPTKQLLYAAIVEELGVEVPGSQNDRVISEGVAPPSDTRKFWLATTRGGELLALRKFLASRWVDLVTFGLPAVVEFAGKPKNILVGYQALDGTEGTPNTQDDWIDLGSGEFIYKAIFVG